MSISANEPMPMRTRSVGATKLVMSSRMISLMTVLALLFLWFLVTELGWTTPLFLPAPQEVALRFVELWGSGYAGSTLVEHAVASLKRVFLALWFAITIGIPIGLLMGMNRWAKGVFSAPIEIYWALPPLAYLPLLIIWLGIDEASKITLLVLATFAPICYSAQAGVRSVAPERLQAALSLGASSRQVFTSIILPSALPEILTGIRISIAAGWATLVAAELIAARSGLGYMIMTASQYLATDVVFVGLVVIGSLAFFFSSAMRWLEGRLVGWKGKI